MATCALCGKQIPAQEIESQNSVLDLLGVGKGKPSPLDDIYRSTASATQAWQCDRCGQWLCNSCVTRNIIEQQASGLQHSNCGGMFRAPGA
jgi:hypothetical protein